MSEYPARVFPKNFRLIFKAKIIVLVMLLAISQEVFASTPEEVLESLRKKGYTDKQIGKMVILEAKRIGYNTDELLSTIENGKKALYKDQISELRKQGLDSGAILDKIYDLKGNEKFHISSTQGFFNSVGGFLGNTAKITGKVAVVSLYAAGVAAKSYSNAAANNPQSTYYVPQQTAYLPTPPATSTYNSGYGTGPTYLGRLSANQYAADSTSNPYGQYGSRYSSTSINNTYSQPGMAARSQYSTGGPKLYGNDGQFLGNLNSNQYDPNSVSNPYGQYGSKYSSTSINNQYSQYGSPYSSQSANNKYTTDAPVIVADGN